MNMMIDDPQIAEKYAERMNIQLYDEYDAIKAAKLCRVGAGKVRQAKKAGELNYLRVGEKRYKFLGIDLVRWKLKMRHTELASTISPKVAEASGVEPTTTQPNNSAELSALALKTFQSQKSV